MATQHGRIFFDPASRKYVAARLELDEGEPQILNTLHFDVYQGEPIGSVPLDPATSLANLGTDDLEQLLNLARLPAEFR